ncbi:hypothetical protein UFOVP1288_80 [uncultured Caudovirales phage]|uniref:Uncharacterized protein n=1 Tax=uncultured Caudovirales phage TaxID=2100421 RepID=A0A6J5R1P9_9CAUD|nr:hypothetical protein UFOVP1195_80 [uncultured Caudovirales phage]CAB4196348.1 hypothetical protein UFOVP1288_80 [uncultured Caudovirales phage]CAB4205246.1 hypothetical protein UFOVP1409_80 [uncultured Caudovirales phage]
MRTFFMDMKAQEGSLSGLEEIDLHPTPLPHRTAPAPHRAPTCTSCGGYLSARHDEGVCYFCEED